MKILVLMPLDERQVFHAMGLYAALDSATKAKCINMPGFMDWAILVGKAKNWEDALLKAIITADKAIRQKEQEDIIVTNLRHYEALQHALESIHRVENGLQDNISGDFISQDIRECIYFLQDIMGEVTSDDVLGNIFKNFCIGK